MNLFEAAVIPSMLLGAIVGGVLCKSFGIFAAIGGVVAGLFAGGFFVMFLMAVFATLWNIARKRPRTEATEEEMATITRTAVKGIFIGIILSGITGFVIVWYDGLIFAGVLAIMTAFISVANEYLEKSGDST